MSSHRKKLAWVLVLGVSLRLALLGLAGELEPWADEGQYVYQAIAWNHFGFYLGSPGWVWPPGYPWFLAQCLGLADEHGLWVAKLVQVLASGVVGWSVAALGGHLFGARGALAAGSLWAGYLPLAAYTHYLWPETVFAALLVPAMYLFVTVVRPHGVVRAGPRLAAAGVLLGLTLLLKEATLPLFVFLPLILLCSTEVGEGLERAAAIATLVLAGAVVVVPWTVRNHQVYGRVVPSGATLGENLYQGINAHYINFDYGGPDRGALVEGSLSYRLLAEPRPGMEAWPRSTAANTIDQTGESVERALGFAGDHPLYFLTTRIKKLADWVSPVGFFMRHQRNGLYDGGPLGVFGLSVLALAASGWVLWFGTAGLFASLPGGAVRWSFLAVVATFAAGAAVVSMSRYRVQIEPFLLVAAAGQLIGRREASYGAVWVGRAALALLALLWLINLQEVIEVLRRTW